MTDLRTPNEMRRQWELERTPRLTPQERAELDRLRRLAFYDSTPLGDR